MVVQKSRFLSLAIASLFLLLLAGISAATTEIADIYSVKVDGLSYTGQEDISAIAGETILIEVFFTALENASDVRIRAEIRGTKIDVSDVVSAFDIEEGIRYKKILRIKLPYELKDELSDNIELDITIWNRDFKTQYEEIALRIQRDSYKASVMSIDMSQEINAGETLSIGVVLKNIGYNRIEDLYATVRIPSLNIQRTSYFGDLVALADCSNDNSDCNKEDTLNKRFYIQIPYDAKEGIYSVEVVLKNDDLSYVASNEVIIRNDFSAGTVLTGAKSKNVNTGEEAQFSLVIANPSDRLKVYRIVVESPRAFSASADSELVAIPAGSSKTVTITGISQEAGDYEIKANIFSGDRLQDSVVFSAKVQGTDVDNSIIVLTVILAIIFIVLLVILIVLLGKKPEKTEEYGESYY